MGGRDDLPSRAIRQKKTRGLPSVASTSKQVDSTASRCYPSAPAKAPHGLCDEKKTEKRIVANHPQALKRHRQSLRRRNRNRHYKSVMKTAVKKLYTAIDDSVDPQTVQELYRSASSTIDKTAKKGVIKPNTAARKIGRLAKAITAGPREKKVVRRGRRRR
jgi:small subunit ribosomal protein S20